MCVSTYMRACVCAGVVVVGGVWHLSLGCCGCICSTQLTVSVFIAGAEQLTLCSATRTEREHFVPESAQAGVSVYQFCLHLLAWADPGHSCSSLAVCIRIAGCDHYSLVPGLTLNMDRYQ